jgi:hypothetical protein
MVTAQQRLTSTLTQHALQKMHVRRLSQPCGWRCAELRGRGRPRRPLWASARLGEPSQRLSTEATGWLT